MATPDKSTSPLSLRPWWLLAAASAVAWLWICWCLFPNRGWNDVRLAPIFGLKLGLSLYPGATGPASTWMYGPLPLLLLWPATWAANAAQALMVAGGLNLAIILSAIVAVCAFWPAGATPPPPRSSRMLAAMLGIALWPGAAWQYLQADNAALALGLLANLVLVRSSSPKMRWVAAFLAMAGLSCKQTSLEVPIAQLLWLAGTQGRTAARDHLLRLLAAGAAIGIPFLLGNDLPGAWFNLVTTPAALPWTDQPWRRLWDLAPFLAVHLGLPAVVWFSLRRSPWRRTLVLPMLTWLVALPLGVAAMLKIGGSLNNLHGFPLWLPPAMVAVCAHAGERLGFRRLQMTGSLVVLLLFTWRIALLPDLPWLPRFELYREAEKLAKIYPQQIWFPWHPLVTVFSDHRLYHVEDGLYVRFVSGRPLTFADAGRHLPHRMSIIALPRNASDWGIALSLKPPNARIDNFGLWTLHSWAPPPNAPP